MGMTITSLVFLAFVIITIAKGVRIIPHEEGDISIELHIVVEHGVNIAAVCRSIINQVRYMVSENTGASIRSIDVCVDSMNM